MTTAAGIADGRNTTYEEYLVTNILAPLNMTRSGFFLFPATGGSPAIAGAWPPGTSSTSVVANMATPAGLDVTNRAIVPNPNSTWSMGWDNPGGGMISTPR